MGWKSLDKFRSRINTPKFLCGFGGGEKVGEDGGGFGKDLAGVGVCFGAILVHKIF